jgi:hypothetical protein
MPQVPVTTQASGASHFDAISRLYEILREHNIVQANIELVRKLPREKRHHLDRSIYGWFSAHREARDDVRLCRSRGTSFNSPQRALKTIPYAWYELVTVFKALILANTLVVLPESIALSRKEFPMTEEGLLRRAPKTRQEHWFLLKEHLPSLTIVNLSREGLAAQMYERDSGLKSGARTPLYLYLPHLRNVPLETLVDLRRNHSEVFGRFRLTISEFLRKSSSATTEKGILEIMQDTDERIRAIDDELRKLCTSSVLRAAGIAVEASVGSVLCMFAPAQIAPAQITPILAAFTASRVLTRGLQYFKSRADRKSIVAGESLYFPWLLHRASGAYI